VLQDETRWVLSAGCWVLQDKAHLAEERDKTLAKLPQLMEERDRALARLTQLESLEQQLAATAKQLEGSCKDAESAQEMFMKERQVRRKLHEQLQVRCGWPGGGGGLLGVVWGGVGGRRRPSDYAASTASTP
jgi:hypothetical protein